jgi:hypothetical protein
MYQYPLHVLHKLSNEPALLGEANDRNWRIPDEGSRASGPKRRVAAEESIDAVIDVTLLPRDHAGRPTILDRSRLTSDRAMSGDGLLLAHCGAALYEIKRSSGKRWS